MANTQVPEKDSVLVRLSVVRPGNIDYPERRFVLTEADPIVTLGRSSIRPSLNLQPAVTNGWYNSPVMSRKHAQLEADFENKTVSLRDNGSMHGTFLNKQKISGDTIVTVRTGDELILGVPVFRHQEEYEPAHMRVDGLDFHEAPIASASRSSPRPTNTFAVPDSGDDDSSDEIEAMNEAMNEDMEIPKTPVPAHALNGVQASLPFELYTGPSSTQPTNYIASSQMDGACDMPHDDEQMSERSALPRFAYSNVFNGNVTHNAGEILISYDSDVEPLDDISDAHSDSGRSLSDSEVDLVDKEFTSDVDELSCAEDSDVSERSPFDDEESDVDDFEDEGIDEIETEQMFEDDMMNETEQPDTQPESDEERSTEPKEKDQPLPVCSRPWKVITSGGPTPGPPSSVQLPPVHDVIPRFSWVSRSESPSDLVFPHYRAAAAAAERNEEAMFALDLAPGLTSGRSGAAELTLEGPFLLPPRDFSSAQVNTSEDLDMDLADDQRKIPDFAKKSGKAEFFEARAFNKDRATKKDAFAKRAPNLSFLAKRAPNLEAFAKNEQVESASKVDCRFGDLPGALEEETHAADDLAFGPNKQADGVAIAGADEDAFRSITSAHEWDHWQRLDTRNSFPLSFGDEAANRERGSSVFATFLDQDLPGPSYSAGCVQPSVSLKVSAEPAEQHNGSKGKRKADAISDDSLEESVCYKVATSSEDASCVNPLTPSSKAAHSLLPSPSTSPEDRAVNEVRPVKKMTKIAEAVGYAALGGFSVGAAVLGSLIYTAPNFA